MSLFKKDYSKLSSDEETALEEYRKLVPKKIKGELPKILTGENMLKGLEIVREHLFIPNLDSIFPNNYLNTIDLKFNRNNYINKLQQFSVLLENKEITERDILNFIRNEDAYFLIGSVLKLTNFGHHDRYIFQELALPPNHQSDFLVIGKNSHGFHFIFLELENPYGNITVKDGGFGLTIRKGIDQIEDWGNWVEKNMTTLRNVITKSKKSESDLPKEFYDYDSSRFHYVVIAGRRTDYNDKTQRLVRKNLSKGIRILHYDNIIDESEFLIKSGHY